MENTLIVYDSGYGSTEEASKTVRNIFEEQGNIVELKKNGEYIGFTGLHTPTETLPFSPCVRVGWRLAKAYWGFGYAPEAAKEALRFTFDRLELDEVVSFATLYNLKSQSVMHKIGMVNSNQMNCEACSSERWRFRAVSFAPHVQNDIFLPDSRLRRNDT